MLAECTSDVPRATICRLPMLLRVAPPVKPSSSEPPGSFNKINRLAIPVSLPKFPTNVPSVILVGADNLAAEEAEHQVQPTNELPVERRVDPVEFPLLRSRHLVPDHGPAEPLDKGDAA